MIHLSEMQRSPFLPLAEKLVAEHGGPDYLIVGKGPSSDGFKSAYLRLSMASKTVRVITLNDACKLVRRPDIAHFIDVEAADRCSGVEASYVLVPVVMHKNSKSFINVVDALGDGAEEGGLSPFVPEIVKRANEAGRLIVYDKVPVEAGRWHWKSEGVLPVRYFSAEAAFGFCAVLGIKKVHSIGIDGGSNYGASFAGLTPLTNGQKDFNAQLQPIADICAHFGMEWERL
jgi:hypothetical protein